MFPPAPPRQLWAWAVSWKEFPPDQEPKEAKAHPEKCVSITKSFPKDKEQQRLSITQMLDVWYEYNICIRVIFRVNVGKYSIHGASGYRMGKHTR